jgi:anti-anti-sigma factor
MRTTVDVDDRGIAQLRLAGELDLQVRAELNRAIADAFTVGRTGVVVDLTGVTFLDSSGLGALVQGYQRAVRDGSGYRIRGAEGVVARVLEISGVGDLLSLGTFDSA